MNKTLLLMSLAMTFSIAACGNTEVKNTGKTTTPKTEDSPKEEVIEDFMECEHPGEYACYNNKVFRCYDTEELNYGFIWSSRDECLDGKQCRIRKSDGVGGCGSPCVAGTPPTATCSVDDYYSKTFEETYYSSFSSSCDETTDGEYYLFEEYELCKHDCDGNTCKKYSTDEGDACNKSSFVERCDGNTVIDCRGGLVFATQCGDNRTCKIMKNENNAQCTIPCADNKETSICDTSDYATNGIDIMYNYQCADTIDNDRAAFLTNYNYCSDCNSGECVNDKKGLDAKFGDECNSYLFQERCADTGNVFICNISSSSNLVGFVDKSPCESGSTCYTATSDQYVDNIACIDPTLAKSCTSGALPIYECSNVPGYGDFVFTYDCVDFTDGRTNISFYMMVNYVPCNGGCDNSTNLCK